MKNFLAGVLGGAAASRDRHITQANMMQAAIYERWNRRHPKQWRVKHFRWYLHEHLKSAAPSTRYRHWLTTVKIMVRLGKTADWTQYLQGPWTSPFADKRPD